MVTRPRVKIMTAMEPNTRLGHLSALDAPECALAGLGGAIGKPTWGLFAGFEVHAGGALGNAAADGCDAAAGDGRTPRAARTRALSD